MESVSRTAGSSSTTKISPREKVFSAMFHRPYVVKRDAYVNNRTWLRTGAKRTRICTGRSLTAQVATHPLKVARGVRLCRTHKRRHRERTRRAEGSLPLGRVRPRFRTRPDKPEADRAGERPGSIT